MNPESRRRAARGAKSLAIVFLLSAPSLLAAPGGGSDAEPSASGPGSVAIVPFVFVGRVDGDLTGAFHERFASLKTGSRIVEEASFAPHLRKGVTFRSDAPLEALLKAAKAAGADTLILGHAASYKFLDAPGVRLRVRMIEVKSGAELHRGLAEETAFTLTGAKREAGRSAAKKLAKGLRAE